MDLYDLEFELSASWRIGVQADRLHAYNSWRVEAWAVDETCNHCEDSWRAYAHILSVDALDVAAFDALDGESDDYQIVASRLLEPGSNEPSEALRRVVDMPYGPWLLLDRVEVRSELRGQGLGRLVTAVGLRMLRGGCGFGALYVTKDEDFASPALRLATALGFTHVDDRVYALDFTSRGFDDTLAALGLAES